MEKKGLYCLYLLHYDVEEAVMLADRVILIEEGKVVMNKEINLHETTEKG